MDCEQIGDGIHISGNFAELLPEKPKEFDYMRTAKWIEPYSFEWREVLGNAVCNCKTVIVHYAPYFGYDYFHRDTCNLMRKLDAEPQIYNLREIYLPAINNWSDSVPNTDELPIWVRSTGRTSKIKVRHSPVRDLRQGVLV